MPSLLCHKCGFNNPPGMRFCGNCGTRLPVNTSALVASAADQEYLPETVGVMVGADLMERFRVAGLNAAGQKCTVTILFADLSGFTSLSQMLDTEEIFLVIQQFMNLLIKDVYKYDGMVDKLLGDGLMAIFGAPIAHEDHQQLALRAAAEMMEEIRQFNFQIHERYGAQIRNDLELSMHIALNSGEVTVGGLGSNMVMNYTAIGDTVNMTSRLLGSAQPGELLVTDTVYQRVKGIADFQPCGPYWLKGYEKPISAYRYVGMCLEDASSERARQLRSALVGRSLELGTLNSFVDTVVSTNQGMVVFLDGESGIGKSRLVTEYRSVLSERGVVSLIGHAYTYKKTIQYWVLQDMLRKFLNLRGDESSAELVRVIDSHFKLMKTTLHPDSAQLLLWILGALPHADFQKTRLAFLDPEQLQREVFTLVRDTLFHSASNVPLVLIFEDMHWADESSLQFLSFVSKKLSHLPILILVVTRNAADVPLANLRDTLGKELNDRCREISLPRLQDKDATLLVNNLLTPNYLSFDFVEELIHMGNGIPYFIEELIRSFIEQGLVYFDESWLYNREMRLRTSINIPDSIQGVILSRFDHLSEVQRRLLQVASIIGRDFNSSLLREVLKISDPLLFDEILKQLVDRGLLERYSDFRGQDFRFTHILMSDTIYGSLLSGDKSELHGMIAQSLEELFAGNLDTQMDVIARHYLYSNDNGKALYYCVQAGKLSAEKYAIEQSRAYFLQAELLMSKVPHQHIQASEIYTGLGSTQVFRGEYQSALDSYRKAAGRLQEAIASPQDYLQLAKLHRFIGEVYEKLGKYTEAINHLSIAQNMVKQSGVDDPIEEVWQLHDLGWVQFRQGNLSDAEITMKMGLDLLEEAKQPALVGSLCNRLAGVYYQQSRFNDAEIFLRRSLAIRDELGDQVAVSRSSNNLGLLQWKLGNWDNALESFQRSLQVHQSLGDVEGEVNVLSNLGLLEIDRGGLDKAENYLTSARVLAEKLNLTYHNAMINLHLSKLCYLSGRLDDGLDYAQHGTDLFNSIRSQEVLADLKVYEGLIWLGKGDTNKARVCGQKAIELADDVNGENKITDDRGRAYRLLSQVELKENNYQESENCMLLSDEIFQHNGDILEQARNLVLRAKISTVMGDDQRADAMRHKARQIFEHYGAKGDLAQLN